MLQIKAFFDTATNTVTYLVWDTETRDAAIIDPVLDFDPAAARLTTQSADDVLSAVEAEGLNLVWVLDTHAHADHLSAADYIRGKTGAKVGISARIADVQKTFTPVFGPVSDTPDPSLFDALFEDGDTFPLGSLTVRVLYTPGHTSACISYLIEDAVFVGDTVFMPDYGTARTDFPGGDAHALYRSIRRLLALPPETRIFVGHDYLPEDRDTPAWEATVAQHRAANIHIHDGVSEADFVDLRTSRDKTLKAPRLILPSLQVNIRAGRLPEAETDGHVYLRLPVNRLGGA
ncbi:MAG: MBL fold metallo-hydrolase [Hyphomonas sp.]